MYLFSTCFLSTLIVPTYMDTNFYNNNNYYYYNNSYGAVTRPYRNKAPHKQLNRVSLSKQVAYILSCALT